MVIRKSRKKHFDLDGEKIINLNRTTGRRYPNLPNKNDKLAKIVTKRSNNRNCTKDDVTGQLCKQCFSRFSRKCIRDDDDDDERFDDERFDENCRCKECRELMRAHMQTFNQDEHYSAPPRRPRTSPRTSPSASSSASRSVPRTSPSASTPRTSPSASRRTSPPRTSTSASSRRAPTPTPSASSKYPPNKKITGYDKLPQYITEAWDEFKNKKLDVEQVKKMDFVDFNTITDLWLNNNDFNEFKQFLNKLPKSSRKKEKSKKKSKKKDGGKTQQQPLRRKKSKSQNSGKTQQVRRSKKKKL